MMKKLICTLFWVLLLGMTSFARNNKITIKIDVPVKISEAKSTVTYPLITYVNHADGAGLRERTLYGSEQQFRFTVYPGNTEGKFIVRCHKDTENGTVVSEWSDLITTNQYMADKAYTWTVNNLAPGRYVMESRCMVYMTGTGYVETPYQTKYVFFNVGDGVQQQIAETATSIQPVDTGEELPISSENLQGIWKSADGANSLSVVGNMFTVVNAQYIGTYEYRETDIPEYNLHGIGSMFYPATGITYNDKTAYYNIEKLTGSCVVVQYLAANGETAVLYKQ